MALITFKTKKPIHVVVGSTQQETGYVSFLELFQGDYGYTVRYDWFWINENGQKIPIHKENNSKKISIEQANAISSSAAPLTDGKTKWEREMIELEEGAKAILESEKEKNDGLLAGDYEKVVMTISVKDNAPATISELDGTLQLELDETSSSVATEFSSSNTELAIVDNNGLVTGVGNGEVVISAKNEFAQSSITLTISNQ